MANRANLDEIRAFFAKLMAAASGSDDPRYERAFELVRREAFLGPGPWHAFGFTPVAGIGPHYVETPSADPAYLYQNLLFALDVGKRINNGEPFLHAGWIGSIAPKPGEVVCHIGAGTGYYSAILSVLTLPGGIVRAFEIDDNLVHRARRNLEPFENVSVTTGDATKLPLPRSDLIYVNAGAPLADTLRAAAPEMASVHLLRRHEKGRPAPCIPRSVFRSSQRLLAGLLLAPSWALPVSRSIQRPPVQWSTVNTLSTQLVVLPGRASYSGLARWRALRSVTTLVAI